MRLAKLLKNNLVIVCTLVYSSIALADGLYSGIQGGYNTVGIKKDNTVFYSKKDSSQADSNSSSTSFAEGSLVGLYAGYGKRFKNIYLAAELDGNINTARARTSNNVFAPNVYLVEKLKRSAGISLISGYFITDTSLLYGRFGEILSKFESDSISAGYDGASGNFNKNLFGTRLGLGMETYITSSISVRGEYDYTFYNSFTRNSSLEIYYFPPPTYIPTSTHYNLRSQQFMLGLSYHFGQ